MELQNAKRQSAYATGGLTFGIILGTAFGVVFENIPVFLTLGILLGTALATPYAKRAQ